ncbi:MAG: hypothetical protein ACXWUG_09680 [Polyangiales bacterium]
MTQNRLASNRLASNRLASNRLASNRLASNSLDSTKLTALGDTAGILSTHSGRIVYSYMISCALADGVTITKSDVTDTSCESDPTDPSYTCTVGEQANDAYCTNGTCSFAGAVGLAPRWADHKLDQDGQGWVSACLFARVNAHDTAEAISLRGNHPALTVSGDEVLLYPLQEGAFYGNVFTDAPEIDWNVCAGANAADAQAQARDCTQASPSDPTKSVCGFNLAGDCADYTPNVPSPYACSTYAAGSGFFGDCHAVAGNGKWNGASKYRQVITTYVAN